MDDATPVLVFSKVRKQAGLPAVAGALPKAGELLSVAPANALSHNPGEVALTPGGSGFDMAASGLSTAKSAEEMHGHFSWRESAPHLLTPVVDQGTCGCCWAVAPASVLSDRIAIRTKQNPRLPFQVFMGCVDSCTLCGSCDVQLAFALMEQQGLAGSSAGPQGGPTNAPAQGGTATVDHNLQALDLPTGRTRPESTSSVTGGGLLATSAPAEGMVQDASTSRPKDLCERVKKLMSPEATSVWKVTGTTKRSPSILELQHAILRDGPVVTIMRVYTDFIVGSDPRLGVAFSDTEGVYVHSEGKTNYGVSHKDNAVLGTHCMAIVGWGQTKSGLQYWEIRNSWSKQWGDKGYCRVAFTAPSLGNSSVGVDMPIVTSRGDVKEANYGNLWATPAFGGNKGVYGAPFRDVPVRVQPCLPTAPTWRFFFALLLLLCLLAVLQVYCAGRA